MRREELNLPDPPLGDRPGDRWQCGRPAGEPSCSRGPSRSGRCPLGDACQPQRTWHGRRKMIVTGLLTAVVATLVVAIQPALAPSVFKPGPLASPHAQILSGTLSSARCAACHPSDAISPVSYFSSEVDEHAGVTQSDRCLDCHHTTHDRETAMLAHNLRSSELNSVRLALAAAPRDSSWHDLLPAPTDSNSVQCNACHREHRGSHADLLAVADAKCQTCHQDRFGSFAASHPDWDQWPYGRGGLIAFDHASHAREHFPATKRGSGSASFQCRDCHSTTANNEIMRTASYEVACRRCHDESLKLQSSQGFTLLALPSLPTESAHQIEPWPETATGFYDGQIAPLSEWLLRWDIEAARAIRQIPDADLALVDAQHHNRAEAAQQIAVALRELLDAIASQGQVAILDRLTSVGIAEPVASAFVRSLPPQLISDARSRWFSDQSNSAARGNTPHQYLPPTNELTPGPDLLSDNLLTDNRLDDGLLADDPLSDSLDPLSLETEKEPVPQDHSDWQQILPQGGWYRDDTALAIKYRGSGHADPVIQSLIEMMTHLPDSDPARRRLLANPAISACVTCHPGSTQSTGVWRSDWLHRDRKEFTKFSHGPHLNIAALADCTDCHRVGSARTTVNASLSLETQFAPLTRQTCAACHTSTAAGDNCVTCHRYHMDH